MPGSEPSGKYADVPLDPPDYSAFYSQSAARVVAESTAPSRLSTLNGDERSAKEKPPSLSQRAVARMAGKPRIPVKRPSVPMGASVRSTFGARSAAANARDQAAVNLAETAELAGKADEMHHNSVNFAAMAKSLNR